MRTVFTAAQRATPAIAESEAILRKCVHCGFCTATCPTYVLLGDELDSPRGRIYLIKDMLEQGRPATAEVVRHLDRCLSCLSCMTTCPSGVDYRRLIDQARVHVEQTYRRPLGDRGLRRLLAWLMPYPRRLRPVLALARLVRPLRGLLPPRLRAMFDLVPAGGGRAGRTNGIPQVPVADANVPAVTGVTVNATSLQCVVVLTGCVQSVMGQSVNDSTVRLLRRAGLDVVTVGGCCGSIVHHLGREAQSRELARSLVGALGEAIAGGRVDAIVSNASGCGAQLKDLAHVLRDDAELHSLAGQVAKLTQDVTEVLIEVGLPAISVDARAAGCGRIAYHSACSMQHGQRVNEPPRALLREAGFEVVEIAEGHLCCGSAGTYNMLQPEIAVALRERKTGHIAAANADAVAAGNLGCITQLGAAAGKPVVHTVELLDWVSGGPRPSALP